MEFLMPIQGMLDTIYLYTGSTTNNSDTKEKHIITGYNKIQYEIVTHDVKLKLISSQCAHDVSVISGKPEDHPIIS